MPKIALKSLISKSPIISPKTKERLLNSLDRLSENQQAAIKKAIQAADLEFKKIIGKALEKDDAKVQKIQDSIDQVWKNYLHAMEIASQDSEAQKEEKLLDSL